MEVPKSSKMSSIHVLNDKRDVKLLSDAEKQAHTLVQDYLMGEGQHIHQPLMGGPTSMITRKKKNRTGTASSSSSLCTESSSRRERAKKKYLSQQTKKSKKSGSKKTHHRSDSGSSGGSTGLSSTDSTVASTAEAGSPLSFILQELRKVSPLDSCPRTYPSLNMTGVFEDWTADQRDAYDKDYIKCIRARDIDTMRKWHQEGRIMQAANDYGESLLHMACRRGFLDVVHFLVDECGHNLWIRDDTGRTPLHDACWTTTPHADLVDFILNKDADMLLVTDKRGHTPLDYARKEHWDFWIEHFTKKDMKTLLPTRSFFVTKRENIITTAQEPDKHIIENLGLIISEIQFREKDETTEPPRRRHSTTGICYSQMSPTTVPSTISYTSLVSLVEEESPERL